MKMSEIFYILIGVLCPFVAGFFTHRVWSRDAQKEIEAVKAELSRTNSKYQKYLDRQFQVLSDTYAMVYHVGRLYEGIRLLVGSKEKGVQILSTEILNERIRTIDDELEKRLRKLIDYSEENLPFYDENTSELVSVFIHKVNLAQIPAIYTKVQAKESKFYKYMNYEHMDEQVKNLKKGLQVTIEDKLRRSGLEK